MHDGRRRESKGIIDRRPTQDNSRYHDVFVRISPSHTVFSLTDACPLPPWSCSDLNYPRLATYRPGLLSRPTFIFRVLLSSAPSPNSAATAAGVRLKTKVGCTGQSKG